VAMILAGGNGQRMDILCRERPKPFLPFAGSLRIIDFSLSNCIHSGIGNIAVLVDYQRHCLSHYLNGCSHWAPISPRSLSILEPHDGHYNGTADAVYQNLEYIRRNRADLVLVLAADHVYKMDYRKMLAFHERSGAEVTVGVVSVPIERASRFGVASVNTEGRMVDFIEKPSIPKSNLASMGIYVFSAQLLAELLLEDAAQASSPHDFGYSIVPQMLRHNRAFAYRFNSYWRDIGTVEAYHEANMELCRESPSLSLNGSWPIFTKGSDLAPAKVSAQGVVSHSIIGPGCVIRGKVMNSILSSGVLVEEQAIVRDSIIMADATIGTHSLVGRCILDEEVNIGKFCYIGFGSSLRPGTPDVTVMGRGATVPSHTAIGHSSKVLPDVGPLDFAAKAIPAGAVVAHGQYLRLSKANLALK